MHTTDNSQPAKTTDQVIEQLEGLILAGMDKNTMNEGNTNNAADNLLFAHPEAQEKLQHALEDLYYLLGRDYGKFHKR